VRANKSGVPVQRIHPVALELVLDGLDLNLHDVVAAQREVCHLDVGLDPEPGPINVALANAGQKEDRLLE